MAKTLTVMFQEIADAIRSKKGTSEPINAQNFATEIENMETGASGEPIEVASAAEMDALLVEENMGKIYKYVGSNTETYFQNNLYEVVDSDAANLMPVNVNELKVLLDATKSASYLFNSYSGTNVDDLISYDYTENVTDMSYMFYKCSALKTIPQLDTSNATTMDNMFYRCSSLQTIPQLDTSNVKGVGAMFSDCSSLQTIPQLDLSNCTTFNNMFYRCTVLKAIPPLDTSRAVTISSMFYYCSNLETIDLTSIDYVSSVNYIGQAFRDCNSLTKLIIRTMTKVPYLNTNTFTNCYHFTGTVNAIYNPEGLKDGRIYVPDDIVERLKVATNWSVYADCIVPLSTLEE